MKDLVLSPDSNTGARSSRSFAPRRALPNGRAVIGALLVTIAATGTFAVATADDGRPDREYLVVVDDIKAGAAIDLDDVAFEAMHLSPAAASNALQTTRGLEGATALSQLHSGAILDVRDLNGAAFVDGLAITGIHELTIPVPLERAPAELRPGDRVAVLAYSASDAVLHTAIEDALVLAFEVGGVGIGTTGDARLTLALGRAGDVTALTRWSYQPLTVVLTTRALDHVYPVRTSPPTTTTAAVLQPVQAAP
jgi:hypothetical protein